MCNLVQGTQSAYVYAADTLSLAAISVVAVNGAIGRGLHPLVAATSGVTICFGGIFRDVLCGRDLAIGGQSYAMATGAGACVYVSLRELALKGVPLPLAARIVLSGGSVVALRAYEWLTKQPLLKPMYDGTHHGQHGGKKSLGERVGRGEGRRWWRSAFVGSKMTIRRRVINHRDARSQMITVFAAAAAVAFSTSPLHRPLIITATRASIPCASDLRVDSRRGQRRRRHQ